MKLSKFERQVLSLRADGLTLGRIAFVLETSVKKVEQVFKDVSAKTKTTNDSIQILELSHGSSR